MQTDRQTCRQTGRHADRQAGRLAGRYAGRESVMQAERLTKLYKQTNKHTLDTYLYVCTYVLFILARLHSCFVGSGIDSAFRYIKRPASSNLTPT